MKRFLPHCLWAAGLVVVLDGVGRYCGHSLPYQDPTPELIAVQHAQLHSARVIMTAGGNVVRLRAQQPPPSATQTDTNK